MTKKARHLKEAKAEKAAKKRRARRRKRAVVLLAEILILFMLLAIGYFMKIYGKFQLNLFNKDDIHINEGVKQEGYMTIALFGADSREGDLGAGTHADTIILASIDRENKDVRLVSIYRDTLVQGMNGKLQKANGAYFNGGPKEAIDMLNKNFDLDIKHHVAVDFKAMADVVDLLGGIEVDVTEEEAKAINDYIGETAMVAEKEANYVSAGVQTLDGVQTVTYARIRKGVGDDFARTERQREVIMKIAEKAKGMELATINDIVNTVFPQVSISFTPKELGDLTAGLLEYEIVGTGGYPYEIDEANIEGVGSVILPAGHEKNVNELHAFLFPKDEYVMSQTVHDIANEIDKKSGN